MDVSGFGVRLCSEARDGAKGGRGLLEGTATWWGPWGVAPLPSKWMRDTSGRLSGIKLAGWGTADEETAACEGSIRRRLEESRSVNKRKVEN
jgi:hypothetical protein